VSRICLDTTVLSEAIREKPGALAVLHQLEQRGDTPVTTAHNVYEAAVGALRLKSTDGQLGVFARLRQLLDGIEVIPFDLDGALEAAGITAPLFERGRPPPTMDLLTASSARRGGCTAIVTRNVADFKRIGVLEVIGY
jgi:predicted nucleic acid-binding protein